MTQPTLFDEPDAPNTAATAEVSEPAPKTARSLYQNRAVPISDAYREPFTERERGFSPWERLAVAQSLAADIAKAEAGELDELTLLRCVRGSLYVFNFAELVRVAKGLINLLGE